MSIETRKDLDEMRNLLQVAVQPKVRRMIQANVDELQKLYENELKSEQMKPNQSGAAREPVGSTGDVTSSPQTRTYLKKIDSYAWDQGDKYVTIYISNLAGIQSLPQDNTTCEFTKIGFNLIIRDLSNVSYQLNIVSLYDSIIPAESKFKVSSDSVKVMLRKAKSGSWSGITELDRKKKEKETADIKGDKDEDPGAGLMNLMKKMYDEGDDEMKRTIAKAWTESQEKRATGQEL